MTRSFPIEDMTRQQIAAFLPDAIRLAIESYRAHMIQQATDKTFSDHHKAAKVAISHIELLIKLARWADLPDKKELAAEEAADLAQLMASAEAEIDAYQEDESGQEQDVSDHAR